MGNDAPLPEKYQKLLAELQQHQALVAQYQQENQTYKNIFSHLKAGYLRITNSGLIELANPMAVQLLGYNTLTQVQGKVSLFELFQQQQRVAPLQERLDCYNTVNDYEVELIHTSGNIIIAEFNFHVVPSGPKQPTVIEGVFFDITNRRKAEETLMNDRETLGSLLTHAEGAIYRCKPNSARTMEYISPGCLELTGHTPKAYTNNNVLYGTDVIYSPDAPLVLQTIQDATARKKPFDLEYRIITAKGQQKWVQERGMGVYDSQSTLCYLEGLITDITHQKEITATLEEKNTALLSSQKALSRKTETLNEINQQLTVEKEAINASAIVSVADLAGNIVDVNDTFCEVSGYSREELMGNNHSILNSGFHKASFWKKMWKRITNGKTWRGEICNAKKNGDIYWVDTVIVPFLDESNTPWRYFSLRFEITKRKVAESKLQKVNNRLEELNTEKDALISIVAHDLKSPLKRIKGIVELIRLIDNPDERLQYLNMIGKTIESGEELIHDLLEINSIEQSKLPISTQTIELVSFLGTIVDSFRHQARTKEIVLQFTPATQKINAVTDADMYGRVVENLLSNAIKFSPANKTVAIALTETPHKVVLEIRDEGPGISQADQHKMFRKFQRLSARPTAGENSTGLGLSIVKALVEKLKGEISVESTLGKGTSFFFELPLARNK